MTAARPSKPAVQSLVGRLSGAFRRPKIEVVPCPRCQTPLTDPRGLGLCNRCGYCRSVEEAKQLCPSTPPPIPRRRMSFFGLADCLRSLGGIRGWGWGMLAMILLPVACSYLCTVLYQPDSKQRVLWAGVQFLVGIAAFVLGHLGMLWFLHTRLEPVSFLDLFFPGNLWRLALRRLPEGRGSVSLAGFGFTAALCAAFWIGGLPAWYEDQSKKKEREPVHAARATPTILKPKSKENDPDQKPRRPEVDTRPTNSYVVLGYTLGSDGKLSSLVLGTSKGGKVSYAGVVTKGLDEKGAADLMSRLSRLPRGQALTSDVPGNPVWVQGNVQCEVHQSGVDLKGRVVDPRFKTVVSDNSR